MASTSQGPSPPKDTPDVEMSTLPSSTSAIQPSSAPPSSSIQPSSTPPSSSPPTDAPEPADLDTTAGAQESPRQSGPSPPSTAPINRLVRAQSEALGPATESPIQPPSTSGPTLSITLMLTTGARHPYKIDEKYLRSRKVELPVTTTSGAESAAGGESGFDPREISGYKLKELVWTDWRSEWEPRPAAPTSIRLIIMGRLVEDKALLKDFPFKLDQTNVVHMTVKPADFLDDDDAAAAKGTGKGHSIRGREEGERGAGCRCVIL